MTTEFDRAESDLKKQLKENWKSDEAFKDVDIEKLSLEEIKERLKEVFKLNLKKLGGIDFNTNNNEIIDPLFDRVTELRKMKEELQDIKANYKISKLELKNTTINTLINFLLELTVFVQIDFIVLKAFDLIKMDWIFVSIPSFVTIALFIYLIKKQDVK